MHRQPARQAVRRFFETPEPPKKRRPNRAHHQHLALQRSSNVTSVGAMDLRLKLFGIMVLAAGAGAQVRAHPLQAEPINHPYVFTFDQFHLDVDGDEALVQGGLLLMAETRCLACHVASKEWNERLDAPPAPDLTAVGSRLDADTIWLMVRSPQHRKKGTLMPGMFSGADDDAEKVEAIAQYLVSLKQPTKPMPAGDAVRGRDLYHKVGCVACHEPAADQRPPGVPPDREVEKPGNASVPIAFADAYEFHTLARFILDPLKTHPAGRMPSMRLTEQEASDMAAYLHVGRTAEKAMEREVLKIAPQTPERGRELFVTQRCSACHATGESLERRSAHPLAELNSHAGCLADKPDQGAPRFDFNPLQRRALRLALDHLQQHAPQPLTAMERTDWQMRRLNCYACHDRDGKGGPEDPRAQYFQAQVRGADLLGDHGRLPPSLDHIGWKLKPAWLDQALRGQAPRVHPALTVRMPDFGKGNIATLSVDFKTADVHIAKAKKPPSVADALKGAKLMNVGGLGCVRCHGLGGQPAIEMDGSDLTHSTDRLTPLYFQSILLNPLDIQLGSPMPALFNDRPHANQEIADLWEHLAKIKR